MIYMISHRSICVCGARGAFCLCVLRSAGSSHRPMECKHSCLVLCGCGCMCAGRAIIGLEVGRKAETGRGGMGYK